MEQLSSCYFCGTALDEPLGTYLLGTDDPGGRVTLCPTCHEKLETVFGAADVDTGVLSKAETSKPASHAGTTGDEAEAEPGEQTGEEASEDSEDEEDSETTDDSPVRTIVGRETDEDEDGDGDTDTVAAKPAEDESTGGESNDGAEDEPVPAGTDADDILVDLGDDDTLDSEGAADDSAAEDDGATGDESTTGDESAPEDDSTAADESAAAGSEETGQAEAEADASDGFEPLDSGDDDTAEAGGSGGDRSEAGAPDRTISKSEFNKVMRLLQNREFPVDRMEIITVATGAYDLRQPEVDQAIDLAVDRGVIDEDEEEEGQLVRPE